MGYFYLMESEKNQKIANSENVNTVKLNKKKYKSKPVHNNNDKNTNIPSNTPKLLKNKDNLKKQEDEQMKLDSDEEMDSDEYYDDDDQDDENIVMGSEDDDYLDKSEDFEEQENGEEEKVPEKDKKIKVEIWDEDNKMQDDEKLDFGN